ncbi:D-alanyl-D-alanine carboxypeptidase [Selenomonadales bacterium OttesenSCG-928-I06]|nr:D-alanyl-D-alanine carboxypeptidase [Selenomonadales bacterium OttesenSCG-928-I06]
MHRNLLRFVSCFLLVILLSCSIVIPIYSKDIKISAKSAILMDAETGQILYEKDINQKLPPASTTKILTAIIALESGRLDEIVTVSHSAASTKGSTLHLYSGQMISLRELITGLLLRSGNDAAEAIAEHLAGSVENFAVLMNTKATLLGAKNSNFINPHGLPENDHLTTTLDLAIITRYALSNSEFSQIVSTKETDIKWVDESGQIKEGSIRNTNKLLWMMPIADGVKTGTTSAAGPCLVASAKKNGQRLIAVVLNDRSRWRDSFNLLQYGFQNFECIEFSPEGAVISTIPVKKGMSPMLNIITNEKASVTIKKEDYPFLKTDMNLPEEIIAPIYKGQKIGELTFYLHDKNIRTVDLVADKDIAERSLKNLFLENIMILSRKLSQIGIL